MRLKQSYTLILSAMVLTACGGGGGGGGVAGVGGGVGTSPSLVKTTITGATTPPLAPAAATQVQTATPVQPVNPLLLPIGAVAAAFPAIAQEMNYSGDPNGLPSIKLATVSLNSVDTRASVQPNLPGATLSIPDPAQPTGINIVTAHGVNLGMTASTALANNTVGGLPAVTLTSITPSAIGSSVAGYVAPYSPLRNPTGYMFQTFGGWTTIPSVNNFWEGWFSTGIPTAPATLPITGKASYTGQVAGTYVDAATCDPTDVNALLNATADFAAQNVTFATSGTTTLSWNAPVGTPWTANRGLDMSGTLNYAAGSNTFTGTVTSANGMSGNATGRFYGPGISSSATGITGTPPEIGGTFAVSGTGIGAMQGAFAGTLPITPTSITGSVVAPAATSSGTAYPGTQNMLVPPNSTMRASSIVQSMDYTFDPVAAAAFLPALKVGALNVSPVDTQNGNSILIKTGAAYPFEPVGQTIEITNSVGTSAAQFSTATGSIATQTTDVAGLRTITLSNTATASLSEYALPYSGRSNLAGYVYQTFGVWLTTNASTGIFSENYFSAGIPAIPATLPNSGKASYIGQATGSFVDANTREPARTTATMNATADFAALSLAFATTGTTSLFLNSAPGTPALATPGLDMAGTLSYATGSNTFTGTVTTANGMSGNATGRFYGPIRTTTGTPPEIGGTFAVSSNGIGAMQGAFGGTAIPFGTTVSVFAFTTPPATPTSGSAHWGNLNMLTGPNISVGWSAVAQEMQYEYNSAPATATSTTPLLAHSILSSVDTNSSLSIITGAAYATDAALGQTTYVVAPLTNVGSPLSNANGAITTQTSDLAGLPTVTLTDNGSKRTAKYVLPYSATLNPNGYVYQTFGMWKEEPVWTYANEIYFSAGAPTSAATLPVTGTATYTGQAIGSFVDAVTRETSATTAAMKATADFGALSIAFTTSGTTSLPANAIAGTLPVATPDLDMSGTLNYATGSNTFTGAVTTANGMSGNTTGRFYGPGLNTAGAPPEIGGTFALAAAGIGAMEGAFGGRINTLAGPLTTVAPAPAAFAMTGTMTPVVAPSNTYGTVVSGAAPSNILWNSSTDMLVGPGASKMWSSITQIADYTYDLGAVSVPSPTLKVTSLDVKPGAAGIDHQLLIQTGAAYPADPTLGQATYIQDGIYAFTTANAIDSQTTDIGGLPTMSRIYNDGISKLEYILPFSAALNPAGYTYQTFGSWTSANFSTNIATEGYFSAGVVTAPGMLPTAGTATYMGQVAGSFVDAATGDPASITAAMTATADFGALSVAFATTGTTTLSRNAPNGAMPTANAGLDMSGTLSYTAGGNTFTGAVTTANGMSGNAIGRFYGPGIATTTSTKVAGAPPEIGGTFAVMGNGIGAMQGAFGGK